MKDWMNALSAGGCGLDFWWKNGSLLKMDVLPMLLHVRTLLERQLA